MQHEFNLFTFFQTKEYFIRKKKLKQLVSCATTHLHFHRRFLYSPGINGQLTVNGHSFLILRPKDSGKSFNLKMFQMKQLLPSVVIKGVQGTI